VIEQLCRGVDGVVSVASHIAYRTDDARRPSSGLRPSPEGAGDHRRARARAALWVSRSYR
ncbi:hypothetical protein ABZ672_05545, partial [Streptomyces mirabilis]